MLVIKMLVTVTNAMMQHPKIKIIKAVIVFKRTEVKALRYYMMLNKLSYCFFCSHVTAES
jgi:hypothetical protein